jgi:hypothetical protein
MPTYKFISRLVGAPSYRSYLLSIRFGEGYTVTLWVGGDQPEMGPLKDFIDRTFVGAVLREQHQNVLHYQLTATGVTLAQIFHHLESARTRYGIEDYSVSQTTLDQVLPSHLALVSVHPHPGLSWNTVMAFSRSRKSRKITRHGVVKIGKNHQKC